MHPNYGATKQLATPLDTSPPIPEEQKCRLQQIVDKFLYYSRAMDCTILPYLNTTVDQKANLTQTNESIITHILDNAATNQSVIVQYKARYMILQIDSDASYLSEA